MEKQTALAKWLERNAGYAGVPDYCNTCEYWYGAGAEEDPCLGHIEGVFSACCGHGRENSPYAHYRVGFLIVEKKNFDVKDKAMYTYLERNPNPIEFVTEEISDWGSTIRFYPVMMTTEEEVDLFYT